MKAYQIIPNQRVRVAGGTGGTDRIWTVKSIDGRQVKVRDDNGAARIVDCCRLRPVKGKA